MFSAACREPIFYSTERLYSIIIENELDSSKKSEYHYYILEMKGKHFDLIIQSTGTNSIVSPLPHLPTTLQQESFD